MGFSPGDFYIFHGGIRKEVHWELRSNSIVLWGAGELEIILEVDFENAEKCARDIELLAGMIE